MSISCTTIVLLRLALPGGERNGGSEGSALGAMVMAGWCSLPCELQPRGRIQTDLHSFCPTLIIGTFKLGATSDVGSLKNEPNAQERCG